jgi:hypothetical protein
VLQVRELLWVGKYGASSNVSICAACNMFYLPTM